MEMRRTADGSQTLYSERFGETMHSHKGALSEARHVFLEGAGVAARLEQGQAVNLLEVGFGTGLNFFLTADKALSLGQLDYWGLEQNLLPARLIRSLDYAPYLKSPELLSAYLDFREALPLEPKEASYSFSYGCVTLTLCLGDAVEQDLPNDRHAVYQDAFSPTVNSALWSEAFLARLCASLGSGGCLTTYSVKGELRRRLQSLGFKVEKRPGPPGGKREMLVAFKP